MASRLSDRAILFGKIGATVVYAWLLAIGSMLVGAVTINVAFFNGTIQFYNGGIFLGATVFSFLVSLLLASVGVLVSLRAENARQAYQRLSIVLIILWIVPFLGVQFLPAGMLQSIISAVSGISLQSVIVVGLAVLIVANIFVISLAMARFQRARLILD